MNSVTIATPLSELVYNFNGICVIGAPNHLTSYKSNMASYLRSTTAPGPHFPTHHHPGLTANLAAMGIPAPFAIGPHLDSFPNGK